MSTTASSAAVDKGRPAAGERVDDRLRLILAGHRHRREVGPDVAILRAGQQQDVGALGGAAGAADLLVVGDRRSGRADVHDEAEIRLVETHPERGGRDERRDLVVAQGVFEPFALGRVGAPGVGRHGVPGLGERASQVLRCADGEGVDDAAPRQLAQVGEQPSQAGFGTHARQDTEAQGGPGQPAADGADRSGASVGQGHGGIKPSGGLAGTGGMAAVENDFDVGDHPGVGGGGRREDRGARRESAQHVTDPAVVGPKIMPPVTDAVRLVDDKQPGARGEVGQLLGPEGGVVEPFGADEQHVDLIGGQREAHLGPVERIGGVHRHGPDAGASRRRNLVAHERQQRRDDDGRAGTGCAQQRRRHEVDSRLAPPGALHDEHALTVSNKRAHRLQLPFVEVGIGPADELPQCRPSPLVERAAFVRHIRHRMPPRRHHRTRRHQLHRPHESTPLRQDHRRRDHRWHGG